MRQRSAFVAAIGLDTMLAGCAFRDVIYDNLTPNNLMAVATRAG